MTAPARIRQEDIARALKGCKKAGFSPARVTIEANGNVVFEFSDGAPLPVVRANPLDRVL
ncbi:hypothetical protein H9L14_01395 [Sphingomonas sediminicola]|uniref:Uncharacterized protein n=1 Tax=Sphingomonas sediminicola TaxID=386874 RepID=A0ABX6TAF6_9SPHN|nr:hypothetical protein [Sphingomonas sediminicola]QNP45975.1 hypothetical protein H9L14_01395 [Sphingomonas sediminicola]